MLPLQKIQDYLNRFKGLTQEDLFQFFALVTERRLAVDEVWIGEGTNNAKLAYIQSGMIRAFTTKNNGEEVTTLLRWEDQFIASHHNVILKQPSRFTYQALEETILLELDYHQAEKIIDANAALAPVRNFFILNMLAESMARVETFILLSPEERYLQLLAEKPDIINRVPGKYIATLLGITPVSLSRIRKRITHKNG